MASVAAPRATVFSPDGQLITTGGGDRKVKLWDMAFSPDGRYLASVSHDGSLKLWAVPGTEERIAAYTAENVAKWGPKPPLRCCACPRSCWRWLPSSLVVPWRWGSIPAKPCAGTAPPTAPILCAGGKAPLAASSSNPMATCC